MKSRKWFSQKNLTSDKEDIKTKYVFKEFLRHIDLNKAKVKKIDGFLSGYFKSIQSGSGFDFNEIREYKMGDDLRHISWNATAKTSKLHTKEYFAEKEVRAYFLVDISTSMFCGNKLEPFINLFVFLLHKAQGFCEKIGGVFFSEDIKYHFPLSEVNSQANIMFQTFFEYYGKLKDKIPQTSVRTELSKGISFAKQYFQRKGIIFVISDFVNLKNWEKPLFDLSQKQNIYSFQIYDSIDFQISKSGYMTLIDPETKTKFIVNTDSHQIQTAYLKIMKENQNNLNNFLSTAGVKHIIIEKEDFC